jgi:membrane-bound serine protease (ClpP class)
VTLGSLAHLSPNHALLLLTAGILLIYLELNRPGWILPGAVGLSGTLFAVASLARQELNLAALALVCTGAALLMLDLWRRTQVTVAVAATLALVLGFNRLIAGEPIQAVIAVGCGLVLGTGTAILTRIARRARTNKGLD